MGKNEWKEGVHTNSGVGLVLWEPVEETCIRSTGEAISPSWVGAMVSVCPPSVPVLEAWSSMAVLS